jgi:Domain of unknown function (DUF4404)
VLANLPVGLADEGVPAPTLTGVMQDTLQELLAHLKDAIDAAEAGADNEDELARLAGEVERRLSEDDSEGVVDDLRDGVRRFEVSHPSLSGAIGRAADALSAIGL